MSEQNHIVKTNQFGKLKLRGGCADIDLSEGPEKVDTYIQFLVY